MQCPNQLTNVVPVPTQKYQINPERHIWITWDSVPDLTKGTISNRDVLTELKNAQMAKTKFGAIITVMMEL